MSTALVVVPTYNERETVRTVIEAIRAVDASLHILVVDDNSPDGTGAIVDELAAHDPQVHVLHRPAKSGLGPAYIEGFRWAFTRDVDWVVEIDADGSHDPRVIPTLLAIARATAADLVIGSRWVTNGRVDGWNAVRRVISRSGNLFARWALGSRIQDLTAGFRAIRVDVLRALDLDTIASSGYCFQIEIADRVERAGGTVIEHPITFVERTAGSSKMHAGIVLEALVRIVGWGVRRRLTGR